MRIQENTLQFWLEHFYGYGSWNARIWLVGFEDGGGEYVEEVAEKFNYFYKNHGQNSEAILCDIRDLYRHVTSRLEGPRASLFANLYEYRFAEQAIQHGVWKNLIAFVHGYRNEKLPDLLSYQRDYFSLTSSHEAWIQLYPLPSPHNHAWYYAWLDMPKFEFLKSRTLYQEKVYADRIRQIFQNMKTYKPDVVLMYAMENINLLKSSVQEFFPGAKFKAVKAIKLQIPQQHIADIDGTTLVITTQMPALHHNRVETGFDWYEVGRQTAGKTNQS